MRSRREVAPRYAHHVLHGTGTFETTPPTEAEMTARSSGILGPLTLLTRRSVWPIVSQIAERLEIAPATLSFHLKTLTQAGLLSSRQESRFIYYAANYPTMDELIAFLTDNCCSGGASCLPKTAAVATTAKRRRKVA